MLHILGVPKGFILSCSRFVGQNPTYAKPKIQGFTPTDEQSSVRLACARGENMKKIISCLSSCCFRRPTQPASRSPKNPNNLSSILLPLRSTYVAQSLFAVVLFLFPLAASPLFAQGTYYDGPVSVTGIFNGNVTTGCSYDPLTHSAHRVIDDIVVPGSIGKYPLKMTRYYNSRAQYYALSAIGLSPGWAHEYSWLIWTAGHRVVSPHGTAYDDYCGPPVGV